MESFANTRGYPVIQRVIASVRDNAASLSEIDGAIGDGDHGVNMGKGFGLAAERLAAGSCSLSEGLATIGNVLLTEIGGAMGPLYGTFFRSMARESRSFSEIDAQVFESMLRKAEEGVVSLGNAKRGDKTMLDTLGPALEAFRGSRRGGMGFCDALRAMMKAAETGKDSTKDMVSRVGRSSRLGERSRGTLDAGAVSCWLILTAMGQSMIELLGG
ncbi:MAG: dihydroxyacetone kinase subunit DhaL [Spirochaetia bacterium]|jgi:dihydroxyacetone kinase-like protein